MDFAAVAVRVTDFLAERGFRSALVGGVGLAAYGLSRTTLDLDLVTDRAAQEPLVAFLDALGYETLHRSEGYANHLHADPSLGRVDFVYVTGETADRLFAACRSVPGPAGRPLPVEPVHPGTAPAPARDDGARHPIELVARECTLRGSRHRGYDAGPRARAQPPGRVVRSAHGRPRRRCRKTCTASKRIAGVKE